MFKVRELKYSILEIFHISVGNSQSLLFIDLTAFNFIWYIEQSF